MKRIVLVGVLAAAVWTAENEWLNLQRSETARSAALAQFGDGNRSLQELRRFDTTQDEVVWIGGFFVAVTLTLLLGSALRDHLARGGLRGWRQGLQRTATRLPVLAALAALPWLSGCKPYDRPEFVEIDTSETGFLIPLEGDTGQQSKFQSEEYLRQRKVATKRVQITHRWSQQGRLPMDGRWIPTVRLVKVNRSPLTREWTPTDHRNAEGQRRPDHHDQAIWIESADSVGFSMGFTCTSFIAEEDSSKFLYWYPSGTLSDVMDREVRGRIQQVAAEVAARYPLDQLRLKKQEISDAVKKDLTNFFLGRGITVTTVGMFGGMTYENPAIQKSIDDTFIAQQLKVVSAVKLEAQLKDNERVQLEAEGLAVKARQEAKGLADARTLAAQAEAGAIREINKAAQEAQSNPLLLQLKTLEVEKARVERWDGRYPQWWMGGGGAAPNLLVQAPTLPTR